MKIMFFILENIIYLFWKSSVSGCTNKCAAFVTACVVSRIYNSLYIYFLQSSYVIFNKNWMSSMMQIFCHTCIYIQTLMYDFSYLYTGTCVRFLIFVNRYFHPYLLLYSLLCIQKELWIFKINSFIIEKKSLNLFPFIIFMI